MRRSLSGDTNFDFNLTNFKVVFSGVRGNGSKGDIALDEISIASGQCSGSPSTPKPTVTPKPPSRFCGQKGHGLSDFPKIVGGQDAQPGEWPWQVALLREAFPFCGGSLVSNQYIITAAHCVKATDWNRVKVMFELICKIEQFEIKILLTLCMVLDSLLNFNLVAKISTQ